MKFKKPKSVMPTVIFVGSAIAGAMVGRVIYSQLPEPTDTTKETMFRGGLALAGAGGSAFVDGNDELSQAVKGAMLGMALDQAMSAIKTQATSLKVENSMAKAALGLGCGCDGAKETVIREIPALGQGRVIPFFGNYEEKERDLPISDNSFALLGM